MADKPKIGLVIYLAGPDVFRPDAKEHGETIKDICCKKGLIGLYPMDNEVEKIGTPQEIAKSIFEANVKMIEECDAVVANITPFRGPSGDVGTVWEMGYARGLGKPVFAYSQMYGMRYPQRVYHLKIPHDGMMIEDFELDDNLMVIFGVEHMSIGVEAAIIAAKKHLEL